MKLGSKNLASKIKILIIIVVSLGITVGFIFFREEMRYVLQIIVERFGLLGLFMITLIMDTVIQPITPEILTVGYSMADFNLLLSALVGGLASTSAGFIGFRIGRLLGKEGATNFIGQKKSQQASDLFAKYGFWAVLVGSMTPIPFSVVCWSAGMFKMPWKFFCISVIVTRIPRFLLAGYIGSLL